MISNGIELMTTDGVLAALSIQGILFLFLTPTIMIVLIICLYREIKKRLDTRKKNKTRQKEEMIRAAKIIDNTDLAMNKLQDLTVKPSNIEKYRTLDITFDTNGNVK